MTRERAVGRRRLGAQSGVVGASGGRARGRLEEARVFVRHPSPARTRTPIPSLREVEDGLLRQARGADGLFRPWSYLRVGTSGRQGSGRGPRPPQPRLQGREHCSDLLSYGSKPDDAHDQACSHPRIERQLWRGVTKIKAIVSKYCAQNVHRVHPSRPRSSPTTTRYTSTAIMDDPVRYRCRPILTDTMGQPISYTYWTSY